MIENLDLEQLDRRAPAELDRLARAVGDVGFLTVTNTGLDAQRVRAVMDAYLQFFRLPDTVKASVDMARTGANRGWGAPRSEQVDPEANPDFKEVFDCGYELPPGNAYAARGLSVYAPNLWPEELPAFREDNSGLLCRCQRCGHACTARDFRRIGAFGNQFRRGV